LAEGIRQAYSDLFAININAPQLSREDVINKLRTLGQGQLSDSVLDKMALTFTSLVKYADFQAARPNQPGKTDSTLDKTKEDPAKAKEEPSKAKIGGLVYNIQLILPESRDPAVYDALFKSLRDHIL
jgi:hypothetical protein